MTAIAPTPTPTTTRRLGGHLVVETLADLRVDTAFGVPGIHALAIWEALRDGPIAAYGTRTELCAGFAADGFARSSGRPAALLVSTGPGALNSLTAVMEASSSHVPVLIISSQIPTDLLGRGRGFLHELPDQLASFRPLVKYAARAESAESIPGLLAEAWQAAVTAPTGPVYVEIPVDLLTAPAPETRVTPQISRPLAKPAPDDAVAAAARLLWDARRPVLWAGGGVIRSGAQTELVELAERLDAPVATTFMGKTSLRADHPLAVGAGCDEAALQELLTDADVLLCVGTELGAETTGQHSLAPAGRIIHLDAASARIGATYPALPLVGDARLTLLELLAALPGREPGDGVVRAARVRDRIAAGLKAHGRETELAVLRTIEDALPSDAVTTWDMTILAYWAAPHLRLTAEQQFLYPLGSGTLGYAWPAALGAQVAHPGTPTLAVVGDGGFQYALAELGTAAQRRIPAKLLIVDDGGYGILREYQREEFGATMAVELPGVDLPGIAACFGVPARTAAPDTLADALVWLFAEPGPAAVILRSTLAVALPTS
jgi:acetolactate synthase-1/2/3 large subunit